MQITRITKENEKFFGPFLTRGALYASPNLIRLGVIEDNRAAGALSAVMHDAHIDITSLYVLPEFRRQGFGSALVDALESASRYRGIETISAEFLEDDDSTAFFDHLGYDLFSRFEQYSFTLGELMRSQIGKRYIEGKDPKHVVNISDMPSSDRKILDQHIGTRDYTPSWSTAYIRGSKYVSSLLASPSSDGVSIVWLNSLSDNPMIFLYHIRALVRKTSEVFPGNMGMEYRITLERDEIRQKITNLLGGTMHMRSMGRYINAVKVF